MNIESNTGNDTDMTLPEHLFADSSFYKQPVMYI